MKRLTVPALAVAIAFLFLQRALGAERKVASFEGSVSATLTRAGADATHFLFTRKGNQLRIEDAARNKPEPLNVVDLASGKLTIIFPHNSTFVRVELTQTPALPQPPNFPTPPNIPAAPIGARPGPAIPPPPRIPSPPPMPSMPFGGSPNGAGGPPAFPMPMMPPMPAMPGAFAASDLKKTDKTRTIQGMECTLYTLSDRGQNFEIWAASDSTLFPFRLLQRDYHPRRFGPPMIEETWVELLQKKSLFPLEATLKMEPGGQQRFSFKIEKIEKRKIDNAALFAPPEKYVEIQAPQF